MEEKKSVLDARLWLCALGTSLVALIVYAFTLAGYVFPGASTHLFTQWMGMEALSEPSFPVWGRVMRVVGGLSFPASLAARMNLFSLLCGVLSSGLVCLLVGFFVRRTVRQENSLKFVSGASMAAGLVAGLAFVFTPCVWQASTHLDYGIFDVCFALVLAALFIPMACGGQWLNVCALALGLGTALGLVEGPIFAALAPVFLLGVLVTAMKAGKKPYLPAGLYLLMIAIFYLLFARMVAAAFLQLPEAAASDMKTTTDVILKGIQTNVHEIRMWLARPGWLYIIIFTVLPFVACMFAAPRGLNNERTWSQYFFHAAMTVCTLLALATPLAPSSLMKQFGFEPVASSTLAAVVAGYLTAYWLLLARTAPDSREGTETTAEVKLGGRLAPIVLGGFLTLVVLAALVNMFSTSRDRGDFADICANEIVDRLGDRTWFVSDGLLDDHLRIIASSRGKELNLVSLQRDMEESYLKELGALIKEKKLTASNADLALSVQLGVLPFLQDWFNGDSNVTKTVAVFGVPDLWYMSNAKPVPEGFFFSGAHDLAKEFDGAKAFEDFKQLWAKMEPVLHAEKGKGSLDIGRSGDPVDAMRLHLRRHVGFVANNLGVTLQDVKMDKEAYELYELVLKTIDPDNISALFNEFEMARSGSPVAAPRLKELAKQLQTIVEDQKRRYALWSLARYYGYIRSAEIFARMGYSWANSALPGNAIAMVKNATDLVPAERQAGLLAMLASMYAIDNKTEKSREIYQKLLEDDSENHEAYMGLMRLALQRGDYPEALKYLERAVKNGKGPEASTALDVALLHLMKNDLGAARLSLQKMTDLQPKSLQAWSLLAGVLLQQFDTATAAADKKKALDELENFILPKMQGIADSPRDYYVQMTRALILMRKGKDFQKEARDALIVASSSRPDISSVGDMILELDFQLGDQENAEKHARQILRVNRHNKLANYVMGSIRLMREDYATAETFLRLSLAEERPLATAQNDLAEALRRQKKFVEAEKVAYDATKNDPNLYVAWETLASILLDQNKDIAKAEECVKQAIEISKKVLPEGDLRMLITLARAQLAKGDIVHFNTTIRTLNNKRGQLEPHDLQALEELQKAARGTR